MSADNQTLLKAITMEVSDNGPCAKKAVFTVKAADMAGAFDKVVRDISRSVKVEGFRPGKVPSAIVRARFQKYILEDVEKLVKSTGVEKLSSELHLVSINSVDSDQKEMVPDKDYKFTVLAEVFPEFTLPDYKNLSVKIAKGGKKADVIAKRAASLREMYAEFAVSREPAASGDMLKVAYTSDFAAPADASASLKRMAASEEAWMWLTEPPYFPGANEALKGVKAGDVREIKAVFPADWREAGLAGKTVNYKVTVKEVQRKTPITDDAELAKKLHVDSVEKMNELFDKQADSQIAAERREAVNAAVMEKIVAEVGNFEIPKSIVESEAQREMNNMVNQMVKSAADAEKFKAEKDKHFAEAREKAAKTVRSFFIIKKIADAEKITVTDSEVDSQIREISSFYGYRAKDLRDSVVRNGNIGEIESGIISNKVVGLIASTAKVTEA